MYFRFPHIHSVIPINLNRKYQFRNFRDSIDLILPRSRGQVRYEGIGIENCEIRSTRASNTEEERVWGRIEGRRFRSQAARTQSGPRHRKQESVAHTRKKSLRKFSPVFVVPALPACLQYHPLPASPSPHMPSCFLPFLLQFLSCHLSLFVCLHLPRQLPAVPIESLSTSQHSSSWSNV